MLVATGVTARQDRFPQFVRDFMAAYHPSGVIPDWIVQALATVNIHLDSKPTDPSVVDKIALASLD